MMHVQKSESDKEKNKVNLEDLQDEDKVAKLMSQVLYLTQDDLERQKKQEEENYIVEQKKAV